MERRSLETDATEPAVHVLTVDRAVEEWKRLEPLAIAHERPALHEFFGRTRSCLAVMTGDGGQGALLGEPAGRDRAGRGLRPPEDLLPVVLAALDRVAKSQQPEHPGRVLHHRLVVGAATGCGGWASRCAGRAG